MRKSLFAVLIAVSLFSCDKDDTIPPVDSDMLYHNLKDESVSAGGSISLDLDKANGTDFFFSTLHIGDPLNQQDRIEFYIGSFQHCQLLFSGEDQTPVFAKGETIPAINPPGYEWHDIGYSALVKQIIPMNGPASWQGNWKNVTHRYLAIQIEKGGLLFRGWIEISIDIIAGKIILHKAALSKIAGKLVKAGF